MLTKQINIFKKLILKTNSRPILDSKISSFICVILIEGLLFLTFAKLDTESEALSSIVIVLSAVLLGIFLGRGPGIFAGLIAALTVDYHYIHPIGKILYSREDFLFLIITHISIQFVLIGIDFLQSISRELENTKLYLERKINDQEEILSVIAHDLRQPLTSLQLRQESAIRNLKDGKTEKVIKSLQDGMQAFLHIDKMIQDLLDGTKIESNHFSLTMKIQHIEDVINEVVSDFYLLATAKKINLKLNLPIQKIHLVNIDSYRIKRVLSNLVSNALKFSKSDSVVEISLTQIEHDFLEIRVRDSGPGIEKEEIENLFQKFWQKKETAHLGTGLGLYICQTIVKAHHGSIWYETAANSGAIFCIQLPLFKHNELLNTNHAHDDYNATHIN